MVEAVTPRDVSSIYAAAQIAQYLLIRPPNILPEIGIALEQLASSEQLEFDEMDSVDKESARDLQTAASDDERILMRALKKAGNSTEASRHAFDITDCFCGYGLEKLIRLKDSNPALVTYQEFTEWLRSCIHFGICDIESRYLILNPQHKEPPIVNVDFKDKALEWMLNEIEKRSQYGEFNFLSYVSIKKIDDYTLRLRIDNRELEQ